MDNQVCDKLIEKEVAEFILQEHEDSFDHIADIFTECLYSFECGDLLRMTIERIGRNINEDDGECKDSTREEIPTEGS